MLVFQDGRDFYRDSDGECIFTAPTFVPDGNEREARTARDEFEEFAKQENIKYTFMCSRCGSTDNHMNGNGVCEPH